jgi:CMP-N-acetylneuraminic acid synthetase
MNPKIVALVPMRHLSERVPGKNYRMFAGKPLYHHIIESLLACSHIAQVVIDTDSPMIMEDAARHFPQVHLIERPPHLRAGTVPMNDVLLNDTIQVPADFYLQTHSTNPLLRTDTIGRAVQSFLDHFPVYDSLFSVTRIQTRLWDGLARAINHNPAILLRTQDLPPVFEENSCLYIFAQSTLETKHNRIGERPWMFETERQESWDIDEELDFRVAEFLCLHHKGEGEQHSWDGKSW